MAVMPNTRVERAPRDAPLESRYQFPRAGYFDAALAQAEGHPVFGREVSLRDSWAKIEAQERQKAAKA